MNTPATPPPNSSDTDGPDTGTAPAEVLDCLGQRCPLPVIALANRLPDIPVGATITVLADDPAAAFDIPAWCRMRGQHFVAAATLNGAPAFTVHRLH